MTCLVKLQLRVDIPGKTLIIESDALHQFCCLCFDECQLGLQRHTLTSQQQQTVTGCLIVRTFCVSLSVATRAQATPPASQPPASLVSMDRQSQ